MEKEPGITFERHQEIGAELSRIDQILTEISVEFFNAYGLIGTKGKAASELRKAVHAVSRARSNAEDQFLKEFPDTASLDTYYPGQDRGPFMKKIAEGIKE